MNIHRVACWIASCLVASVLVTSIVISGSPDEQRLMRLDERRIEDLARLSTAFDDYWEERDSLPVAISELLDGRRLSRMPTDPRTGLAYEYEQLNQDSFRLCATFDRSSLDQRDEEFWAHATGHQCFSFVQSNSEND